jgi:hypothetical protein
MALFVRIVLLSTILFPASGYAAPAVPKNCPSSRPLSPAELINHAKRPWPRGPGQIGPVIPIGPSGLKNRSEECLLRQPSKELHMYSPDRNLGYKYVGMCTRMPAHWVHTYGCWPGFGCAAFVGKNGTRVQIPESTLVCDLLPVEPRRARR